VTEDNAVEPQIEGREAREAQDVGEKPDLGQMGDALIEALDGSDSGSDTRAGSLRGGSASGSDEDPDSAVINEALAAEGRAEADPQSPSNAEPNAVAESGRRFTGEAGDPVEGGRGGD
jgi:hypothetical protein